MSMTDLITAARVSKAWPFQEAQRLLKRYPDGAKPDGSPVLFETGYGPSGLPHIGTFQEVLRTTLGRRAFEAMIGAKPDEGAGQYRQQGSADSQSGQAADTYPGSVRHT